MATNLVVRNVDESIALALKRRAAAHGRSAEAEHRELLRVALQGPPRLSLTEFLLTMPDVGTDADFERASAAGLRGGRA
jgi:plasmid stability protein